MKVFRKIFNALITSIIVILALPAILFCSIVIGVLLVAESIMEVLD